MSAPGRFCCKSLFALLIKNSKGYKRDVRVNMWGTSSPDDKLVTDLAKARLMAGKLSPLNFGLLQQNLPLPDVSRCSVGTGLLDHLGEELQRIRDLDTERPRG